MLFKGIPAAGWFVRVWPDGHVILRLSNQQQCRLAALRGAGRLSPIQGLLHIGGTESPLALAIRFEDYVHYPNRWRSLELILEGLERLAQR